MKAPAINTAQAALMSAMGVFAAYLVFLPSVPYWLDAPEFISAAWNLGQPHPPGHPVVLILLKFFLLFPLGDAAFRANLFSAVFAALSSGLLGLLAAEVVRALDGKDSLGRIACVAAALGFGFSGSLVLQALSVEVYTFNAAIVLGAILLAVRYPSDWRAGALLGVLLALGAANHHLLTFLALPALTIAFVRPGGLARAGLMGSLITFGVVTLGCYALLWVRDLAGAWPAWADTSTPGGLAWFASARIFAGSVGGFEEPGSGMAVNALKAVSMLARNLTPVGAILSLGGLYLLIRSGAGRLALVLATLMAFTLLSKVAMGILDPDNPDDHGYFLVALGVAVVLGVAFGVTLVRIGLGADGPLARLLRGGGWATLTSMALLPLIAGLPVALEREHLRDPGKLGRVFLDEQPPRSVLFLSHYPVLFQSLHLQWVEGSRPDVTVVQESLYRKARGGKRYARGMAKLDPDLRGVVDRFLLDGTLDWQEVMGLDRIRPVHFEPSPAWEGLAPAPVFSGWTLELDQSSEAPRMDGESTEQACAHVDRLKEMLTDWPELEIETRRVVMRNLASSASYLISQGSIGAARMLVSAALELNPGDRILLEMARRVSPDL